MIVKQISNKTKTGLLEYIRSAGLSINDAIENINQTNNTMLSIVDKSISYADLITSNLSILANQLQDVVIVGGALAKTASPFQSNIKSQSNNIVLNGFDLTMYLDQKDKKVILTREIKLDGNFDKSKYIDTADLINGNGLLLTNTKPFMNLEIEIAFIAEELVSAIDININNNGINLPKIKSVTAIRGNGTFSKCTFQNTNTQSKQLLNDDSRLLIEPVMAKKIIISLVQDDSELVNGTITSRIDFKKINVISSDTFSNGDIIIGPITSDLDVLKIALQYSVINDHYKNVNTSVSLDAVNWLPISQSNSISQTKKIINFNNVDKDSIFNTDSVKKFYVKFELSSVSETINFRKLPKLFNIVETINGYIDYGYNADYEVQGVYIYADKAFGKIKTEDSLDGIQTIYGLYDNKKLSLSEESTTPTRVFYDYEKVSIYNNSVYTAYDYIDKEIAFYGISTPIYQTIGTGSTDSVCLKLKVAHDVYRAIYNDTVFTFDLRNGFAGSIDRFNYEAKDGDIFHIYNSIGDLVATVNSAIVGGKYIMSLYDVFFEPIPDTYFNKYYPVIENVNKYSISKNKIVRSGNISKDIHAFVIHPDKIIKDEEIFTGSKSAKLAFTKKGKNTQSLAPAEYNRICKLGHTNIIPGTVVVDSSGASIVSVNKEVEYKDGREEFVIKSTTSIKILGQYDVVDNLTVIDIEQFGHRIASNSEFSFYGQVELFINRVYSSDELIEEGDYMIDGNKIKLPIDIFPSQFVETEIRFDSISAYHASGLFSIDYANGILYTEMPIDGGINITYQYSLVYASYNAVKPVDDSVYINTGSSIIINGEDGKYYIQLEPKEKGLRVVQSSPIIKDINIYYMV